MHPTTAIRKESPYMPLRLKATLKHHNILQADWAKSVRQTSGFPISETSATLLLNYGQWLKATPAESIKAQTAAFLASRAVPADEIAAVWAIDPDDAAHGKPIRGPGCTPAHLCPLPTRSRAAAGASPTDEMDILEVEMLFPETKRHFQLFRDPFRDEMSGPDDVFLDADQRYVAEAMFQTARHGGFLAVVGESGSGKSTLRKLLLERVRSQPIRVSFPMNTMKARLSGGDIYRALINDLAPDEVLRSSYEAQARQLHKALVQSAAADYVHVLIIEEAHQLTIPTLKLLKQYYEFETGFRKLLSIILIGQPELKDKLDERRHPEAREVIRRIEIAELAPMAQNAEAYYKHKFIRAGSDMTKVFAPDAVEAMRARWTRIDPETRSVKTSLYPLFLNNAAVKCMNKAAQLGVPLVTGDLVREV